MGNKSSRRKSDKADSRVHSSKVDGTTAVQASPAVQLSSVTSSEDKKGESCPDLAGGAVPYRDDSALSPSGPRHVNYTVYRSYSNVAEAARRSEPRPDIRFSFRSICIH